MDALKLLTRSTKLKPASNNSKSSGSVHLPSAGKAENPQLFPDSGNGDGTKGDFGGGNGKKRKRGMGESEFASEDGMNLDFFGSQSAPSSSATVSQSKKGRTKSSKKEHEEDEEDGSSIPKEEDVMDESERRSILKSHKIKIVDLEASQRIEAEKSKVSKKKKKKHEPAPVLSNKQRKEAQRLYPEPLTSFQQLRSRYQISRRLFDNIREQGYSVPTEVQLGSLPILLGDCGPSKKSKSTKTDPQTDLLVVAPTGSGKTLSFLIPLVNNIVRHHHQQPDSRGLLSIVVAPTKELSAQIVNEGRKLTVGTGVKITAMRKGMKIVERAGDTGGLLDEDSQESDESEDEEASSRKDGHEKATLTKSDIIVTTPLLLVNALSENQTKPVVSLPSVRNLVLDEADVLLDPLFREQTLGIWHACTSPELRVSLWSATMGSSIEETTKNVIKERRDSIGILNKSSLFRLVVGLKDSAIPNISHKLVYAATEQGKLLGLRQLLHPTASSAASDTHLRPPFLVFTQTIPRAVALHSELMYDIPAEAGGSSRIAVLHSDLSETQRSEVMKGFRKGEIWILITTDLLARGVDFQGINGVVNYDIPNSGTAYVHRVGRTGRAGREGGVAVTFYTKEDIPYIKNLANVIAASEKLRGKTGEKGVQKWLLDALPSLSKNDKKELKKHGVKIRRPALKAGKDGKEERKSRISTKSGFERRMENNRKGAVAGSRNRKTMAEENGDGSDVEDDSWSGIDD
ncbi:RNA-dependent ATPase rok1 [Arachnomyces sp. PD_36]|nr:RNA-dependent ATPase rok1 [Arachnomyces sp. PD_36]